MAGTKPDKKKKKKSLRRWMGLVENGEPIPP
jgi:hypothetical protein